MAKTNESTDVVVIGSGATGLSAALTAAEGGAKVVLLEKMRHTGGTSNFPEGMFAVESEMQRLYAGGMDAGGVYGDSYDVYATGGALGFAFNSGRIAGKNVLKYIGISNE